MPTYFAKSATARRFARWRRMWRHWRRQDRSFFVLWYVDLGDVKYLGDRPLRDSLIWAEVEEREITKSEIRFSEAETRLATSDTRAGGFFLMPDRGRMYFWLFFAFLVIPLLGWALASPANAGAWGDFLFLFVILLLTNNILFPYILFLSSWVCPSRLGWLSRQRPPTEVSSLGLLATKRVRRRDGWPPAWPSMRLFFQAALHFLRLGNDGLQPINFRSTVTRQQVGAYIAFVEALGLIDPRTGETAEDAPTTSDDRVSVRQVLEWGHYLLAPVWCGFGALLTLLLTMAFAGMEAQVMAPVLVGAWLTATLIVTLRDSSRRNDAFRIDEDEAGIVVPAFNRVPENIEKIFDRNRNAVLLGGNQIAYAVLAVITLTALQLAPDLPDRPACASALSAQLTCEAQSDGGPALRAVPINHRSQP